MSTTPILVFGSSQHGSSTGLGYHPDLPDPRDHTLRKTNNSLHPKAAVFLERLNRLQKQAKLKPAARRFGASTAKLPSRADLRLTGFLSPVENQQQTNACTAYAAVGAVEYLMRMGRSGSHDVSPAFLYRNTRRLLGWSGDVGADVRTTIKSLRLFGVPPDSLWPMLPETIDDDPDAFTYSFAANFRNISYARLDGYGTGNNAATLHSLRQLLACQLPVVFGFPVFGPACLELDAIPKSEDCLIRFPKADADRLLGGHAVVAVGYDDALPTKSGTGAVLIRNSWGTGWGNAGYAYLPYEYFLSQLAVDVWLIYNNDWLRLEDF